MTSEQTLLFCDAIAAGHGRHAAAQAADLTPADLAETLASDPSFRQRLAHLEGVCRDTVRQVAYAKATEEGSLPAAKLYLSSIAADRMGRLDYRLKRRQVEADERRTDHETGQTPRLAIERLTPDEFKTYKRLYLILRERDHISAEAVEYSALSRKLATPRPMAADGAAGPAAVLYRPAVLAYRPNGNGHANGNGNGHGGNGHS